MRAPERLGPYVYRQSDTCFPLGGDSLALAAFASVRRGDRVCDLGCGAGALLLLLAARVSPLALSGVRKTIYARLFHHSAYMYINHGGR